VRAILDDGETPDAIIAVDGIHSSSQPTKWQIDTWKRYFDLAMRGSAVMIASCTQITPPTFSSTRKTISLVMGADLPKLKDSDEPIEIRSGSCRVHVYPGRGREAHIKQANTYLRELVTIGLSMIGDRPSTEDTRSIGERSLDMSFAEMSAGVKEEPPNSNTGPRIREYHYPCMRDGKRLGLTMGAWCASAFSYISRAAGANHEYRASGLELQQDAIASGTWRDKGLIASGKWAPEPGDGVILKRGTGWQRHVCRFVKMVDADTFQTIGGNEGNKWRVSERTMSSDGLIGFIEMPRNETADISPEDFARFYDISKDVMLGKTELVDAMASVDELDKLS
jgi:hypothetical protein